MRMGEVLGEPKDGSIRPVAWGEEAWRPQRCVVLVLTPLPAVVRQNQLSQRWPHSSLSPSATPWYNPLMNIVPPPGLQATP